ncbi:MAG: DNA polymerase III subunit delta' [Dehalococcoidia bacterium]
MSWTLVGQERATTALSAAVKSGRVAHAYLFAGPRHVGKSLAAMQFAQALNCESDDPPCGGCRACERIASGMHPDVETVGLGGACDEAEHRHTADDSRFIRICQVRRLERIVSRAPFEGRQRVLIIEPADAVGPEAAAALLKTLEEPPPNVVMVLLTDREEMLLDTIRSRTRRVAFGGIPQEKVEQALRNRWDAEPQQAAELARMAGGRLGQAVLALRDPEGAERRVEALKSAEAMAQAPLSERFVFADRLGTGYGRNRSAVQATLEAWQEWWRDVLLVASGREEQAVHRGGLDTLRAIAAQCGARPAARALRAITDARQQLEENASPVLALEAMMLTLPRTQPNAVSERLASRQGGNGVPSRAP